MISGAGAGLGREWGVGIKRFEVRKCRQSSAHSGKPISSFVQIYSANEICPKANISAFFTTGWCMLTWGYLHQRSQPIRKSNIMNRSFQATDFPKKEVFLKKVHMALTTLFIEKFCEKYWKVCTFLVKSDPIPFLFSPFQSFHRKVLWKVMKGLHVSGEKWSKPFAFFTFPDFSSTRFTKSLERFARFWWKVIQPLFFFHFFKLWKVYEKSWKVCTCLVKSDPIPVRSFLFVASHTLYSLSQVGQIHWGCFQHNSYSWNWKGTNLQSPDNGVAGASGQIFWAQMILCGLNITEYPH